VEIKQAPSNPNYIRKGTQDLKCTVCRSWKKKQPDGTRLCVTCYFRNKQKEEAVKKEDNPAYNPNIKIGKL